MKSYISSLFLALLVLLFVTLPTTSNAAGSLINCTTKEGFKNLCGSNFTDNPGGVIRNVIIAILVISAVVALIFLIWGGFKWITSGGDKTKVEAARNTIIAAVVGLIVAFLAYFILAVVLGIFGIKFENLSIPNITVVSEQNALQRN